MFTAICKIFLFFRERRSKFILEEMKWPFPSMFQTVFAKLYPVSRYQNLCKYGWQLKGKIELSEKNDRIRYEKSFLSLNWLVKITFYAKTTARSQNKISSKRGVNKGQQFSFGKKEMAWYPWTSRKKTFKTEERVKKN